MTEINIVGTGSNSDVETQVDRTHRAGRVSIRPWEHDAGGHYRIAGRSGGLTSATVTAAGPLFSLRWSPQTSNLLLALLRLKAFYIPTVVFSSAQELGLDLARVTGFTASDSTGTAIVPSAMRDRAMPASSVTDARIAATTVLTAGTRTVDTTSVLEIGGGLVNVVNAAAATAYVNPTEGGPQAFGFDYDPLMRGEYPLILSKDEGFLVRNTVVFPAAGTATLVVVAHVVEFSNQAQLIVSP